jgi:hypothetical protein
VVGLVSEEGTRTSHAAILAHSLGIQPFTSHFQVQLEPSQLVDIGVFFQDNEKALELTRFIKRAYGAPNFGSQIQADSSLYNSAVLATNGLTAPANAAQFGLLYDGYAETEAEAQAICMQTRDFRRAYDAFVAKHKPQFAGS